jgi:hypothetical protein
VNHCYVKRNFLWFKRLLVNNFFKKENGMKHVLKIKIIVVFSLFCFSLQASQNFNNLRLLHDPTNRSGAVAPTPNAASRRVSLSDYEGKVARSHVATEKLKKYIADNVIEIAGTCRCSHELMASMVKQITYQDEMLQVIIQYCVQLRRDNCTLRREQDELISSMQRKAREATRALPAPEEK